MKKVTKVTVTGLVAVHLLVTLWHWYAHRRLGVTLPLEQGAFVLSVVILAPLVAGLLVWTRHPRIGVGVFLLSMLGSFLFGVYHHFVDASVDHVGHLPNGSADARAAFIISATALALMELGSALYGAFCLQRLAHEPARVIRRRELRDRAGSPEPASSVMLRGAAVEISVSEPRSREMPGP